MRIAFISTYPPRKCGIATFCNNMVNQLYSIINEGDDIKVFALISDEKKNKYSAPVVQLINKDIKENYLSAASKINLECDVCIIQFEHGIYGGNAGIYLLSLLKKLNIPIFSILHTVLKTPTFHQRIVVNQLAHFSNKVIVMSKTAIGFLKDAYLIDSKKIIVIEHGLPDYFNIKNAKKKADFGWKNKNILITFGLISSGKGYEYAIKALPTIIESNPNTLFIIIGQTHPSLLEQEGEKYRNSLIALTNELNLQKHLIFINRHVTEQELMDYLSIADIYICPYLNENQITSGTLSYALGAGVAIIATPFWHSKELCDEGYIINVPFKDHQAISENVNQLLSNQKLLNNYKTISSSYGYSLSWPKIIRRYLETINQFKLKPIFGKQNKTIYPKIDFSYLKELTDEKGIIQHAEYHAINYTEGYCLDDNARALLCILNYQLHYKTKKHSDLIDIYFNFIERSQQPDGAFYNFASFPNQEYLATYSEDATGRTIWVLGLMCSQTKNEKYNQRAKKLILNSTNYLHQLQSPRGVANSLIGIALIEERKTFDYLANQLITWYQEVTIPDWDWFENYLTYDNGILPLSLLYAYQFSEDENYLNIAIKTLDFLNSVHFKHGYLNVIGNKGWYVRNEKQALYSQQPIDVMASILANVKAFEITANTKYKEFALKSINWFYGENIQNAPLYDQIKKSCHDGLTSNGISENQGAESTIVYLLSRIEIEKLII